MEWNVNFARKAVEIITAYKSNIYFMPIRVNTVEYLNEIFKKLTAARFYLMSQNERE